MTRTVQVVDTTVPDTTAPIITLLGANPQIIELGQAYTELNASSDDGSTVVIDSSTVDTNTEGNYTVTYNATDTVGNVAVEVTRTVTVQDSTIPVITLLGNPTETVEINTAYIDAGATASDNGDGNITANIVTNNPVDITTAGSYTITYDVNDSAGNSAVQVTRTVTVQDSTIPVITLLGNPTETVEINTAYTDAGATASDNGDGNITANIVTNNPVDITTAGSYTITYDVNDSAGNSAVQVTRTVTVQDSTIPVITLLGNPTETVEINTTLHRFAGATASDNGDGNITANIVTNNPVDILLSLHSRM